MRAVLRHDGRHGLSHYIFLPDVAHRVAGLAAIGGDFILHRAQLVGVAANQHHMRAQRRQLVRRAAPNARAAARHHHHLPGEQAGRRPIGNSCLTLREQHKRLRRGQVVQRQRAPV
jgi:hypothetical protein